MEDVVADDAGVRHHALEVRVQVLHARLLGEVEAEVEEVGGEQVVELLEVCPGPVHEALVRHVPLRDQGELQPVVVPQKFPSEGS